MIHIWQPEHSLGLPAEWILLHWSAASRPPTYNATQSQILITPLVRLEALLVLTSRSPFAQEWTAISNKNEEKR